MGGLSCIFLTFAARRAAMNSSRFFRQSPFFAAADFPAAAAADFDAAAAAAWNRDVNIIEEKVKGILVFTKLKPRLREF